MNDSGPSTIAYVSVGSNVEPNRNVEAGLRALLEYVTVIDISMHYASRPTMRPEQSDFINGVWKIETDRDARSLKIDVLREVERRCGRNREEDTHAARTLDLDLLLYGDLAIQSQELWLPDPDVYTASFVAVPLAELAPNLILPDTGIRVDNLESAHRLEGLSPLYTITLLLKGLVRK